MRIIVRAARRRFATSQAHSEEGAALLLVMTSILVTTALSILILGLVMSQMLPTQFQAKRVQTIATAQAGIDAATSQIRTAIGSTNNGTSFGGKNLLPCHLAGSSNGQTYDVTITYYDSDPTELPVAEQAVHSISCTPGSGTQFVPSHALLLSKAVGASIRGTTLGNRSLQSIYSFELDNGNIPGGLMWTAPAKSYCLKADSATAGAQVKYISAADCVFNDPLQMFVYNTDYTLVLASTLKTTPLCIQGSTTGNVTVALQVCNGGTPSQLWSYEGGAHFRGQNSGNTNYGSYCLSAGSNMSNLVGKPLMNTTQCPGDSEWGSFAPDPSVGAGAASYNTKQIVNYYEFGRCMDVTNETISYNLMIVYPCKQDPSGGTKLKWNHKWYYQEKLTSPQTITVLVNNDTSQTYCLTAASASTPDTSAYVTFKACSGAANQQFVRAYKTPDYSDSYTFTDFSGRCLAIGPKWNNGNYSTIVSATCNGGSAQKWNAPQLISDPGVSGTREIVGSTP
ncbi:hypothetical protein GCM10027519_35200 [Kineococcus endophyticus]